MDTTRIHGLFFSLSSVFLSLRWQGQLKDLVGIAVAFSRECIMQLPCVIAIA